MNFDMLLNMAQTMGFDVFKWIDGKLPEWVADAKRLEEIAGAPLMCTINLAEQRQHFVVCLYKQSGSSLDLWKSFHLTDSKSTIEQIKTAVNEHSAATPEPTTARIGTSAADHGTGNTDTTGSAISAAPATDQHGAAGDLHQ